MRILLVNHFPLEGSGSGTYTKNIAMHLKKAGHEVCVIFPDNIPHESIPGIHMMPVYFTGEDEAVNGLPFNFPCFTTHPRSVTSFAELSGKELAQYMAVFDDAISRAMDVFKPDIIHSQHIWCLSWLSAKYPVPIVITAHGTDLMGCEKWPEYRGLAEIAVRECNRIIAISRDNMEKAQRLLAIPQEKMALLPNGYNEDVFYPDPQDRFKLLKTLGIVYNDENIVFFAGKLTAFKGVDTLLKAAAIYEETAGRDIITLIAGDGEEREALKKLKDELKLKSVHFIGHRSQEELRRLYSSADVFIMPSRREPFGLVALEAMACGLSVVASNEGGLREFVVPGVGMLVPADNEKLFSDAVLVELSLRDRDPEMGLRIAVYTKEKHSQKEFIKRLERLYRDVLSEYDETEEDAV